MLQILTSAALQSSTVVTGTQIAPIRLAIIAVIVMWASQEMDLPAVSGLKPVLCYETYKAIAVKSLAILVVSYYVCTR